MFEREFVEYLSSDPEVTGLGFEPRDSDTMTIPCDFNLCLCNDLKALLWAPITIIDAQWYCGLLSRNCATTRSLHMDCMYLILHSKKTKLNLQNRCPLLFAKS